MGLLPALAAMADEVVVADVNGNQLSYTYDEADGPATFTGIKAYSADEAKAGRIVIADRITDGEGRGHDVLYVSGSVSNRQKLVSIVFGKNIIATGGPDGQQDDAFYNCKQLESVTLNSKLEILGRYTFQYCNNLVDINLAEATSLRKMMYRSMQSTGIRELTVPVSVREFDDVFPGCDSVRTLTFLADSVPAYFFRSSRHLETINIGPGVKYIGTEAFSGNRYMTSLNISSDVSGLVIGENAFANSDRLPSVSLPVGVSELQYGAFYDCDSLRTFTFADGSPIKEIPQLCFYYCVSLESITLPDAVETLGPSAFYQCRSLREINFGTGLTTLPDDSWYIFSGCDQLKKVVLPCANYPFTNNVWFPSDVLLYVHPDLVDTYRTNEFTSNYHIIANGQSTDFVVTTTAGGQLQTRVEEIGPAYNVMNLTVAGPVNGTDIDYLHTLPNIEVLNMKEASIVAGGDSYHQWDVEQSGKATVNPYYGPWNTEDNVISRCMFYNMPRLRSLSLPKGATKIGEWAVGQDRNHSLRLKHVELPEGITEIGRYAFEWTGIETLTVPAGVTRLEENTFANCRNLKKAVLPDGITFIGNSCFSECQSMEDVNIPAQIETIENDAFYGNAVRT
ncbi:MAG: leucine-rich repeat domain-containing protein, partial [Prevotella sp.]|nr:leucine-rich repeat domain-containing protein [Prevotella sp.]